ncbi:MAG: hypothetical protein ACOH10_12910 [Rhodoglobus sp.]
MTLVAYRSHRDSRFEHSTDAIDAIIDWNCHGCTVPNPESLQEFGDGGDCDVLVSVAIGDYDTPIPALFDNGLTIRCERRRTHQPPQSESLFEIPNLPHPATPEAGGGAP